MLSRGDFDNDDWMLTINLGYIPPMHLVTEFDLDQVDGFAKTQAYSFHK
jgi:hypothetical protein